MLSAFETAVSGALWQNERVHEVFPEVSDLCSRCEVEIETDFHTIWDCPCNNNIDSDFVRKSNRYKGRASAGVDTEPCLWLRGILPLHYTIISKEDIVTRRIFYTVGDPPPLGSWPSGAYYGDGSGGKYGKIPVARRCGCSIVCLNENNVLDYGLYYSLPGEIQTVPRAELSSIVTLLEVVEEEAVVVYFGDNKPVIDLYYKGQDICAKASNADLYRLLFAFIKNKKLTLHMFWMPSHLDDPNACNSKGEPKERPEWVQDHDIVGNKEADKLADRAAEIAELPEWVVQPVIDAQKMAKHIQLRIATIICNLPKRKHVSKQWHDFAPPKINPLTQAEADTEHNISVTTSVAQCSKCLSKVHIKSAAYIAFLKAPCKPAQFTDNHTASISGQVTIRNKTTHITHNMHSYRGVKYCAACGFIAQRRMQSLIKPCNGSDARTMHGQRVLDAIAAQQLPPGVTHWPDP